MSSRWDSSRRTARAAKGYEPTEEPEELTVEPTEEPAELRRKIVHTDCGVLTTVSVAVAERLAQGSVDEVYCMHHQRLFPVEAFTWLGGEAIES